jgi:dTMP kinase
MRVLLTREPGGTPLGDRLRDLILDPASPPATPLAMALLLSASRNQLVDTVIGPALAEGQIVVVDRYADSTVAYQSWGLGVPAETVGALNRIATGGLKPDITIYLDVDPRSGLERMVSRGRRDRLDAQAIDFHQRVRDGYHSLMAAEPERWISVDGQSSPEAVHAAIMEAIEPRLGDEAGAE